MTAKRECSEKAYHSLGNWGQWDPCSRKATVEHDGKWYCWQHDPERIEADKKKRRAAEDAKQSRRSGMYARRARNARLGPLVTEELAELLERLANEANLQYGKAGDAGDSRAEWAIQLHADDKAACATAARIREAMEVSE